jgi:zinc-finger of transposase IS204/IS1001/IS1096/IS1165
VGQQGNASGSLLLGLDGLEVVSAELVGGEWHLAVQTTARMVGCAGCGMRATPHGRRLVRVRDLPIGGRPVVLWWPSAYGAVVSGLARRGPGPSG